MAEQVSAPQNEEWEGNAQAVEAGTGDLGRVEEWGLDVLGMGSGKLNNLARDAKKNKWLYKYIGQRRPRRAYPQDKSEGRTGDMRYGEGWGTQWVPCLSLHWQSRFPCLWSHWSCRWRLGEQSPFHSRWRAGLRPLDKTEQTQVYGTGWHASQGPEGTGWLLPSLPPSYLKSHGIQVKSLVNGQRGNMTLIFKKWRKEDVGN